MTAEQLALGGPIINSVDMVLVPIPSGEFIMGSPEWEAGRQDDETQHPVRITRPFYLSAHEVTQQQYEKVMGNNPSRSKGATKPVGRVSWEDAVEFCRKRSGNTPVVRVRRRGDGSDTRNVTNRDFDRHQITGQTTIRHHESEKQ